MAHRTPTVRVIYTPHAKGELNGIWFHNAETRGVRWADNYLSFLVSHIDALSTKYDEGKPVEHFPTFKHVTFKKRSKGDGHIVIYEVDTVAKTANVLHVFHTKQDWQNKL